MANLVSGEMPAWKSELTAKLAESRARRSNRANGQPHALDSRTERARALEEQESPRANVAAAVAARYAARPSYREALEREAAEAALAAERALREAQAAQEAVRQRLEEAREAEAAAAEAREAEERLRAEQARIEYEQNIAVRYEVDERTQRHMQAYEARRATRIPPSSHQPMPQSERGYSDPLEDATVAPAVPLAANLIEFPRELVASRKARPRLAEGPLRDSEPATGQLRIFEVEPEAIETQPTVHAARQTSTGLDWSSIRLDSPEPARAPRTPQARAREIVLEPATLEDRLMAALVDGALSTIGFLVFVFVFATCTSHPPSGKIAFLGAASAFVGIFAAYQWIFFRFGESTPGMLYARIALCSLDNRNPSRGAMQRRIGALLLSTLPLGLGLLWAAFDEDRLGWHDRISGTYQRSYR